MGLRIAAISSQPSFWICIYPPFFNPELCRASDWVGAHPFLHSIEIRVVSLAQNRHITSSLAWMVRVKRAH